MAQHSGFLGGKEPLLAICLSLPVGSILPVCSVVGRSWRGAVCARSNHSTSSHTVALDAITKAGKVGMLSLLLLYLHKPPSPTAKAKKENKEQRREN